MGHTQAALVGKLKITGILKVETGMHIGGSSEFAPIGAVDKPFIRDILTQAPIIPGSSIKGKMRTLLAKKSCSSYILNDISEDSEVIKRLFGSAANNKPRPSRLQFFDLFMTKDSIEQLDSMDTDTYLGEVKFENSINRLTGEANPRQIERVPAGAKFNFTLVYNIESEKEEILEDIKELRLGLDLLSVDYLGGHGSRGYGRISITIDKVTSIGIRDTQDIDIAEIDAILRK